MVATLTRNFNTRLANWVKRIVFSLSLPGHAVINLLTMFHLETEILKRGREPHEIGMYLPSRAEANHLINKGLISPANKKDFYHLTRAGIYQCNVLLESGYDDEVYYKDPARMDEIFPYEPGCTNEDYIKELMMNWGASMFDYSGDGFGYPPVSFEQVNEVPPYQDSYDD